MNTIHIHGVTIGAGQPKIAVSLTGGSKAAVLTQARALREWPVDIIEWRMDCFDAVEDTAAVRDCLTALRPLVEHRILLATFRSAQEGGKRALSSERYIALNEAVLAAGAADLLDVELFAPDKAAPRLIDAAHSVNRPVILSSHDFQKTPPVQEMVGRLCRMQELGGDILKLAVMPQCRKDVLALLQATEEMESRYARRPLVTMSMGELGRCTRLCGGFFGSCITFGAAEESSAPGQVPARKLHQILHLMFSGDAPRQ